MKRLFGIILILATLLACVSCDALSNFGNLGGNGETNGNSIFDQKTPRELHSESVKKYNDYKEGGTPYSVTIVLTVGDDAVETNLVYDGERFSFKQTAVVEGGYPISEMVYYSGKMYYSRYYIEDGVVIDSTMEKSVYDIEYSLAKNIIDQNPYVSSGIPAMPHELPDGWLDDLKFTALEDGSRMLEINVDEEKSQQHLTYSDFYRDGAVCKIYFTKDGKLTKIEVDNAGALGVIMNVKVSFDWDVKDGVKEPDDKDTYVPNGSNGGDDNQGDSNEDNQGGSTGGDNTGDSDPDDTLGDYYWGTSIVKVQLYENDNHGELSSGLKRFYAGESYENTQLDKDIRKRNDAATSTTGVDANYIYESKYGWGGSISEIIGLTHTQNTVMPDVYCNFVFDMTSCVLRGCFMNLYTNTDKSANQVKIGQGQNYFEFAKDGYEGIGDNYFDSRAGGGYLYEYMQSLAIANVDGEYDKMYCLASDYTLDVIRAFALMPVDVDMMNIELADWAGDYIQDRDGDGDHDIDDFYKLVWDGGWTYEALAEYSEAVFQNKGDDASKADIKDVLGVAFGRISSLTASGLLYSTGVSIIQQTGTQGDITYAYPESNQDLVDFTDALYDLFSESKGICSVTRSEVNRYEDNGDIVGIRERFGEGNTMLFGGIALLGYLAEDAYQNMTDNGKSGFGVAPVPLYKEGTKDDYRTFVHNVARVMAIAVATTEFEQCTAFLNYQSTNSADIVESYYNDIIMEYVSSGTAKENNVKMLNFIRNHAVDCFDKTYEDIVTNYMNGYGNTEADAQRWHQYLRDLSYMVSDMAFRYGNFVGIEDNPASKSGAFEFVLSQWQGLEY